MVELLEKTNGNIVIKEQSEVVFDKEYDIVIAGLGVAGAIALISSAKEGKRSLGIECLNASGGSMTMSGVCGYYFGGEGGIYEKIDDTVRNKSIKVASGGFLNPDYRKVVIEDEYNAFGADTMYESIITGVYREGKVIIGVRVFDGEKELNIETKALIDATGDGEVIDIAQCEYEFGRKTDGSVMPYSIVKRYYKDGIFMRTNHDCGKTDQRNTEEFSKSVIEAYSVFAHDDKSEILIRLQSLPGIREGRLIKGEYRITLEDVLEGKFTNEPVMYAYSDLDKHGIDLAFDSELFKKWHILANLGALNITIPVPLGAFVTKEYDNLAVAGRCLSMDHEVATHIRMNRDMQKSGEAVAVAVAMAIDEGVAIKNVDYNKLKTKLCETGCLNEENNKGFFYGSPKSDENKGEAKWITDVSELDKALSTLKPGLAIWSAKLMGKKIIPHLKDNVKSSDDNLKKHSAIALAVMDDNGGVEILREIVEKRDRTMLLDMRKQNKRRISQAITALGILKDKESIDIILQVICDKNEHKMYERTAEYNACYYRTLSTAVAAINEILTVCPERRREVFEIIERELSSLEYIKNITSLNKYSSEYVQAKEIYDIAVNMSKR